MMKALLPALAALGLLVAGCSDDSPTDTGATSKLNLSFTGLEDLGANARYEGWIMVNGSPKTTGTFTVNSSGVPSTTEFTVNAADLAAATAFILTIEPLPDPSPNPSDVHYLAGDFSGMSAPLAVGHGAALGNNFAGSIGKYVLATPTDGEMTNEKSGVWFLDLTSGNPTVGFNLPTLPAGWEYEGWTVIGGKALSTGRFTSASTADKSAPYSGAMPGPAFPGEDFLTNAPTGLTFPTDLSGSMMVISIEPSPDNSPNPFTLKPLIGTVPASAADHVTYTMGNESSQFPTGTAAR